MGFIIVDKYAIIIYCIFFYEFTVVENILITMNYNLKENQSNKRQTLTNFVSFYVRIVYKSTKKASSTIWSIYFILQNILLILCNISKFTILQ